VYSDVTRLFYGKDDTPRKFRMSIEGAIKVLLGLHLPFDVVPEWELSYDSLKKYTIIILPNVAAISKEQAEAIKTYVFKGGKILGTFETSLFNEEADQLNDFQLREVFGLKYIGSSDSNQSLVHLLDSSSFLYRTFHRIFNDLPDTYLRLEGPYIKTEKVSGETIAYHIDPIVVALEGKKVSWDTQLADRTDYPAVQLNEYGKGKSIFVTSEIFKPCSPNFLDIGLIANPLRNPHGLWWREKLVENMLKWLDPNPPLGVVAPRMVETAFFENNDRNQIIVQLMNTTAFDTIIPVRNISIVLRKDIKVREVYLPWPTKRELKIKRKETFIEIMVPETKLHEVIIIQR